MLSFLYHLLYRHIHFGKTTLSRANYIIRLKSSRAQQWWSRGGNLVVKGLTPGTWDFLNWIVVQCLNHWASRYEYWVWWAEASQFHMPLHFTFSLALSEQNRSALMSHWERTSRPLEEWTQFINVVCLSAVPIKGGPYSGPSHPPKTWHRFYTR